MAGKLITLPLRVSLRSAQLVTRVAGRALEISGRAIQVASSGRVGGTTDATPPQAPVTRAPRRREAPVETARMERPPDPPAAAATSPDPTVPPNDVPEQPAHVSEEPVLVRESAEPGAEEGAGARVTVAEPWNGYGRMTAPDVIDRISTATVAELAAMRLYEARHRSRRTVLAAVDRQMKLAGGARPA